MIHHGAPGAPAAHNGEADQPVLDGPCPPPSFVPRVTLCAVEK